MPPLDQKLVLLSFPLTCVLHCTHNSPPLSSPLFSSLLLHFAAARAGRRAACATQAGPVPIAPQTQAPWRETLLLDRCGSWPARQHCWGLCYCALCCCGCSDVIVGGDWEVAVWYCSGSDGGMLRWRGLSSDGMMYGWLRLRFLKVDVDLFERLCGDCKYCEVCVRKFFNPRRWMCLSVINKIPLFYLNSRFK